MSSFRQSDLTRALKAAKNAGVDAQIKIDLERKVMTIIPLGSAESEKASESNLTPDDELERWRKKRNAG